MRMFYFLGQFFFRIPFTQIYFVVCWVENGKLVMEKKSKFEKLTDVKRQTDNGQNLIRNFHFIKLN